MKAIFFFILSLLVTAQITHDEKPIAPDRPNVIIILSDDLGWGDLGCFGQQKIQTPHIDRLAHEGMIFTQAYAGSSVCAPSRSSLMQGLHQGHARVRGNSFHSYRESLQPEDYTLAIFMQEAGYKTGLFGKWGLANHDQPGIPTNKGFDEFFGYLNQRHAHCFYPEFLYDNTRRVFYPENGDHHLHKNYSRISEYNPEGSVQPNGILDPKEAKNAFDEYSARSLAFVRENYASPFFLYLAYTLPHGPLIAPSLSFYQYKNWPQPYKEWAAMVSHMDAAVGELMRLLEELNIDENTLIIFASDNGDSSHGYEPRYKQEDPNINISDFFQSSSPTRGRKGGSFDGSFHVPALAWWPNKIAKGQNSDHLWAFWDVLPTVADIIGKKLPGRTDGISLKPTLLASGQQEKHPYLYWEFNQVQVIRSDRWLARRPNGGDVELYDLTSDPEQLDDISSKHPDIVGKMNTYFSVSHTPSNVWPSPGETAEEFAERRKANNLPDRPNNIANF